MKEETFKNLDIHLNNNNGIYLWYPREYIKNLVFNSVYCSMFGKKLGLQNNKFKQYLHVIETIFSKGISAMLKTELPSFIGEQIFGKNAKLYNQAMLTFKQLLIDDLNQLLIDINNSDKSNNNIDTTTLVGNIRNESEYNNDTNIIISDLCVMLLAGLDTSSHATEVGVLLLAKYPNMQSIIQTV